MSEEFSSVDLISMKQRFKKVYKNDQQIVFIFPNGLYLLTLNPKFANSVNSIKLLIKDPDEQIKEGDYYLEVDKLHIKSPVSGTIVDYNEDIENCVKKFRDNVLSSYCLLIRPARRCKENFNGYVIVE